MTPSAVTTGEPFITRPSLCFQYCLPVRASKQSKLAELVTVYSRPLAKAGEE